jgi:manganese/zinc/iron transport system permease protein
MFVIKTTNTLCQIMFFCYIWDMYEFLEFFSLSDPNVRYVVIGSILLTSSSALVGCFTLLRKRALIGDVIAHSVLPGVCLAFIFWQEKNPFILMCGALVTGWLSIYILDKITQHSRIKEDTALALILSVFFGFGILLLTFIQHSGNPNQSGLDNFLFGKATSLTQLDIYTFGSLAVVIVITILLFFKEFTFLAFDENFATSLGLPVKFLRLLLTSLTVFAVVLGIQAVGVVLMAAMLITPAAAARFWTDRIKVMLILAAVLGAISGLIGAYISYIKTNMPTGPWIVLIISIIAIGSFVVAPKKGILYQYYLQYKNRKKILEENILKTFFHLGENDQIFDKQYTIDEILSKRNIEIKKLKKGLKSLTRDGYLKKNNNKFYLTNEGKLLGQRVTRTHRLWELYLTNYLNIAPDHVHDDAETIEHILTPELEKRLEELLQKPEQDPHSSQIPYKD